MIAQHIHRAIPGSKLNYVNGGADRRNYRVDFRKIRTQLDFEPHFSVANGIDELLGALHAGFFADYAGRTKFYRNETLTYRPVG
jgi:nucleoside-diphosphate-sugar epimerase